MAYRRVGCALTLGHTPRDVEEEARETYQISQYVDFVKEHFLLIFIHVALPEDLHGSLSPGVSVNTHPHLAEGAYAVTLSKYERLPLPSILPIL